MTEKKPETLLEKIQARLKDHPYIVALVLAATVLGGAVTAIENSQKLFQFFYGSQLRPSEIILLLDGRAAMIAEKLEKIRRDINEEFAEYQRQNCDRDLDARISEQVLDVGMSEQCLELAAESFRIAERFGALRSQFLLLHSKHIEALASGNLIFAREIDAQIRTLLEVEFVDAASGNVGIDPGIYLHGFRILVVDVRRIAGFHASRLYEEYQPIE